ncbi:DegT/DnrJ/EryC1/StrS family aminotransferase [Serratia marcescens]|uniref:DegT/DnrJ/EryC1/StrS family aminotransferase n=1 Tax=Serratia marcescens TaxID=615 RepID=UPI00320B92C3
MFQNIEVDVWSYKRENENDRAEILAAVDKVFSSGQLILGRSVAGFEDEFASYHGSRHCIGVDNGTNALILSLRAVGICAGEQVTIRRPPQLVTSLCLPSSFPFRQPTANSDGI